MESKTETPAQAQVPSTDISRSRRDFLAGGLAAFGGLAALALVGSQEAHAAATIPEFGTPLGPEDESYWARVRAQFLIEPGYTYLNNGGLGVPPKQVIEAISDGYRRLSMLGDSGEMELYRHIWDQVQQPLARFVGAEAGEIALTRNATEAINIIANGIELKPGDEVIITTDEHPAGLEPWLLRHKRYGVMVRQVRMPLPPKSPDEVVDLFRRAITPRTKVLFFSHITRGPGLMLPAKALCTLAREHGLISAVDGAQSIGMMPVDLHEMGCDLFASSPHKWLLAPCGTGLLYVRKGFQNSCWPLIAGGNRWKDKDGGADRYSDIGTHEFPVRAAASVSLQFITRIGIEHIAARNRWLSDYLKQGLSDISGVRLVTSADPALSSPGITTFGIDGRDTRQIGGWIESEYAIRLGSDTMDRHDFVRVSTHFYNTRAEVDEFLNALRTVLKWA